MSVDKTIDQYRETKEIMQSIIDRHMSEAFAEIQQEFGTTPISVMLHIIDRQTMAEKYPSGAYAGCSLTLGRGVMIGSAASGVRKRMNDAELIAALRRKPYDRACREAARRLEELLRDTRSPNGASASSAKAGVTPSASRRLVTAGSSITPSGKAGLSRAAASWTSLEMAHIGSQVRMST